MIHGNVREREEMWGPPWQQRGALNQDGPRGTQRMVDPYITFAFPRKSLKPMIFEVQRLFGSPKSLILMIRRDLLIIKFTKILQYKCNAMIF